MNLPAIVLAISTAGLGCASVYLYTELDAARERAEAEAALRLDQDARVKALEEARVDLERQVHALAAATAWTGEPSGAGQVGPPRPDNDNARAGAERRDRAFGRMGEGMRENFRNAFNSPEARQAMQAQQKMGLRMQYRNLASELNLTPDQANQLIDLLAQQQSAQFERFRNGGNADPNTAAQLAAETQRKNELELVTLLGSKYPAFQNYQDTLPERSQVEQLGVQFSAANIPLTTSQNKQLMSAMAEVRKSGPAQPGWSPGADPQQRMQQMRAWQEDYNKRVRERVANVLSSEQLAQYDEMQKAGTGMAFGMGGGRGMAFSSGPIVRRGGDRR